MMVATGLEFCQDLEVCLYTLGFFSSSGNLDGTLWEGRIPVDLEQSWSLSVNKWRPLEAETIQTSSSLGISQILGWEP